MSYEQDFFSQRLIKQITVQVPLEMESDGVGYVPITENDIEKAINYDLKSIILTERGERMDPYFGVGVRSYLFENYGSEKISSLKTAISTQVSKYMPWLTKIRVNTNLSEDHQTVFLSIEYKVNQPEIVGFFDLSISLSSI